MAIDYWKLTKDFKVGDVVQKFMPGFSDLSPYVGRVTAVLKGIGFLDVQWPFGNERVSPEEVVKVNPQLSLYLPPTEDSSYYPGWDTRQASKQWNVLALPPGCFKKMAALFHRGAGEVQAYDLLWHMYPQVDDDALKTEIQKFYRVASNMVTALILEQARKKDASYWAATDRKYRATKQELQTQKIACPKCKTTVMRKATYKMDGGQRIKLFACPSCMHLVKQTDILSPVGDPVEW